MAIYQLWAIVGFIFLFVELAVPTLFFLNLAIGAFFGSIAAYFVPNNIAAQVITFIVVSVGSLIFLRPFLVKRNATSEDETGIEGKYIGKQAQVIQKIGEGTPGVGKIKIYGEVWDAKIEEGEPIEPFEMVEIVRNESLVMFVKRVKGE